MLHHFPGSSAVQMLLATPAIREQGFGAANAAVRAPAAVTLPPKHPLLAEGCNTASGQLHTQPAADHVQPAAADVAHARSILANNIR